VSPGFVTVESESFRLRFWPECGGRLISIEEAGAELLWRSPDYFDPDGRLTWPKTTWRPLDGTMGSWANVGGSKTWPAPQGWSGPGEWPGPPDPILDSGDWSASLVEEETGTTLTMTSPVDERSGLQVTRAFVIPRTGSVFRQTNTFCNIGERPVRWSIWEVCQVSTETCREGGELMVAVADAADPTVMLEIVGQVPLGEVRAGRRMIPVEDVVGKLGFANATGMVGLVRPDGASVRIGFEPQPEAEYPDGGSRAELWIQYPIPEPLAEFGDLHPQARLVELEVLGPIQDLQPGASSQLHLEWTLTPPSR